MALQSPTVLTIVVRTGHTAVPMAAQELAIMTEPGAEQTRHHGITRMGLAVAAKAICKAPEAMACITALRLTKGVTYFHCEIPREIPGECCLLVQYDYGLIRSHRRRSAIVRTAAPAIRASPEYRYRSSDAPGWRANRRYITLHRARR